MFEHYPEGVLIINQTEVWQSEVHACLGDMDMPVQFVPADAFRQGQVDTSAPELLLILIEGGQLDLLQNLVRMIDANFLRTGGPVIVVTECVDVVDQQALLMAGASRVIERGAMAGILRQAVMADAADFASVRRLRSSVERRLSAIGDVMQGVFYLKTRREAKNLATMLSLASREPAIVAVGLVELIINGIEHGCLEIGHDEKGRLIETGQLGQEIRRRRTLPGYDDRLVAVAFHRSPDRLEFTITDPGCGFDFAAHMISVAGHAKKHGRGILMAQNCFDEFEYRGIGNVVHAVHYLK